ncbi:MAG: hypothetical protein O2968_21860, partial [Acidobacteria bacterium]|nr:hypothetical protein [Acidobacteriota bacterium]
DGFILAYIAKEDRVVFINGTGPASDGEDFSRPDEDATHPVADLCGQDDRTQPGALGLATSAF